jgi:hypothetical protein
MECRPRHDRMLELREPIVESSLRVAETRYPIDQSGASNMDLACALLVPQGYLIPLAAAKQPSGFRSKERLTVEKP